ncbi:hypothetical protein ACFSM5_04365 [Lacibacterium aquatile]|uniref:Uncharacterized protein n=1 Tax=Lacibacterium aquatile TaxID=1168082 RepID=A0ABW5DQ94_9PROT
MRLDAKTLEQTTATQGLSLQKATESGDKKSTDFVAVLRSVQGEQKGELTDRFASRTSLKELDTLATLGSGLGGKLLEQDPTLGQQLQASYQEKLAVFEGVFGNLCQDEGISNPQDASFRVSATGTLQVIGDHPQKEKIRNLITRHTELGDLFTAAMSEKKAAEAVQAQADAKGVAPRFSVLFDGLRTQMEFERKAISGSGSAADIRA